MYTGVFAGFEWFVGVSVRFSEKYSRNLDASAAKSNVSSGGDGRLRDLVVVHDGGILIENDDF